MVNTQKIKPKFWPKSISTHERTLLEIVQAFEESQWWPDKKLKTIQNQQFASLLNYAKVNTSFYAERLKDFAPFTTENLTEDLLSNIPYTTRSEVQKQAGHLVVNNHNPTYGNTCNYNTSGSVGQPLTVTWNQYANLFTFAKSFRYHQWHGSNPQKNGKIYTMFPQEIQLNIERVKEIPRSKSGKFEDFRREPLFV